MWWNCYEDGLPACGADVLGEIDGFGLQAGCKEKGFYTLFWYDDENVLAPVFLGDYAHS